MNSFYLAITFFIVFILGCLGILEFEKITLFGFSLVGYLVTIIDVTEALKKELKKEYSEKEVNSYLNKNTFTIKLATHFYKNAKCIQDFTLFMIFNISMQKKKYSHIFYYIVIVFTLCIIVLSVALIFSFSKVIFIWCLIVFISGTIIFIRIKDIVYIFSYFCTFFIILTPLMRDSLMKFDQDYISNQLVILTLVGIFLLFNAKSKT